MHNYSELKIWKEARILMKEIYLFSSTFPESENFSLTSQIRRAAVSPSNIAEGAGRFTDKEFM